MRTSLVLIALTCLALVGCSVDGQTDAGPTPTTADATTSEVEAGDAPAPDPVTGSAPDTDPADETATPSDETATGGGTEEDAVTSQPADPPIPVEGEGDTGDGSGPGSRLTEAPLFGVSSEIDSDGIPPYTSCWTGPDDAPLCVDGFPQPQAVTLTGSERLVVTYEEGELIADASAPFDTSDDPIAPRPADSDLPVELENPGIWLVDISGLEPGDHAIGLSWFGEQGDAFTAFTLTIER